MSKWSSAFRDPRWQQKRLEIMQRDEFTCQSCQATDKTLNVHHIYYEKNKAPWDYEEDMLVTWCEDCHTKRHEIQKSILKGLATCSYEELVAADYLSNYEQHVLNIVFHIYTTTKNATVTDSQLINMIGTERGEQC